MRPGRRRRLSPIPRRPRPGRSARARARRRRRRGGLLHKRRPGSRRFGGAGRLVVAAFAVAATALPEPLTARAAETTAPARVPAWTGAASGAAPALVEAAVEVEVMATAPVRARGSTAAASGAAPAPLRGLPLPARGRGTTVVGRRLPRTPYSRCRCVGPSRSLLLWRRRWGSAPSRGLALARPVLRVARSVCPPLWTDLGDLCGSFLRLFASAQRFLLIYNSYSGSVGRD